MVSGTKLIQVKPIYYASVGGATRHTVIALSVINPRHMREGYGTWFAIRCPSSCRDQRSLLRAGKVMT